MNNLLMLRYGKHGEDGPLVRYPDFLTKEKAVYLLQKAYSQLGAETDKDVPFQTVATAAVVQLGWEIVFFDVCEITDDE